MESDAVVTITTRRFIVTWERREDIVNSRGATSDPQHPGTTASLLPKMRLATEIDKVISQLL